MIDNIAIKIPLQYGKNWIDKLGFDNRLDINTFQGSYKNLKIKQTIESVYIFGSLAKYLNNENITPLDKKQVRQSLEAIKKDTDIDISKGIVLSVECGVSVIVKSPVINYLTCFDYFSNRKYSQSCIGKNGIETVMYNTRTGAYKFIAYDKINEMRDKGQQIPLLYKGQNVIRLEYKIVKRQGIKSIFTKDLCPFDLCNSTFYRKLTKQFHDFYLSIPKNKRNVFIDMHKQQTPKQLQELLAEQFRQAHHTEYATLIKVLKDKNLITSKNYERVRGVDRKNRGNVAFSEKNQLISELDSKVQSRALYGA